MRGFAARFEASRRAPTECWPWHGGIGNHGYGKTYYGGRNRLAHCIAYEVTKGPVPDGLELDHLCRNRACVNPAHLEAVTRQINVLRGISPAAQAAQQTHCLRGHEFVDGSWFARPGRNERICKECQRLYHRRYYTVCKNGHELAKEPLPGFRYRVCGTCKAMGLLGRHRHRKTA